MQVREGGDELVDAVAHEFLELAVDAGGGGESAGEEVVLVEELVEVSTGTADGVGLDFARGKEMERCGECEVALLGGDLAVVGHLTKDLVALAEGGGFVIAGGEVVGRADDANKEGAFCDGELGGFFPKVGLSGLFDSVGSGSKVDAVEVGGDDFVFVVIGFDAEGEGGFEELAVEGEVSDLVGVARELHCDGGGALGDATILHVAEGGPQHAAKVDSAMLEKFFVLAGGEGVDEGLGDFLAGNNAATGAMDGGEFFAIAVEEEGALLHFSDLLNVVAGGGDPISDAHEKEENEANDCETQKNACHRAYPSGDLFPDFRFVFFQPSHAL